MSAKETWEAWRNDLVNLEDSFRSFCDMLHNIEDEDMAREGEALMEQCHQMLFDWIDRNNLDGAFEVSLENDHEAYTTQPDTKPRKYRSIDDK